VEAVMVQSASAWLLFNRLLDCYCCRSNQGKLEITNGIGTCSITATKAANVNYNQTTSVATTVTISKANQATLNVTSPTAELSETSFHQQFQAARPMVRLALQLPALLAKWEPC
jgi:hypothetical protein